MVETHRFIQGVFNYQGRGLNEPVALEPKADYIVPAGKRAHLVYCRVGNPSTELICLILKRDGKLTRYFPVGARAGAQMPHALNRGEQFTIYRRDLDCCRGPLSVSLQEAVRPQA
jgi:hypothetical protein